MNEPMTTDTSIDNKPRPEQTKPAKKRSAKPKTKKEYSSLDTLLEDLLNTAATAKNSGGHRSVLALLKSKISFQVTSEIVREVLNVIDGLSEASLIRFKIVSESEFGRSSSHLLTKIAEQVTSEARNTLNYPLESRAESTDVGISYKTLWWARNHASLVKNSDRDIFEIAAARLALICLLPDKAESFFIQSVLRTLERCIKQPKAKTQTRKTEQSLPATFAKIAVEQLAAAKPGLTLKVVIELATSFGIETERLSAQLERANSRWRDVSEEVSQLEKNLSKLQQSCNAKEERLTELEAELKHACDRISEQEEQYAALEEYWKEKSQLHRNEVVSKIKNRLNHEMNEIHLCLDRESADTAMAIDRVNSVIKYLSNLEIA